MKIVGFFGVLVAALFFALGLVAASLPQVYGPEVADRLALGEDALGLLILLFPAVVVPAQLIAGILLDRYGARSTMMAAAAIAGIGLVLGIALPVPAVGASGRALLALGAAFGFIGALFIVAQCFSRRHFASYAGMVQAIGLAILAWWLLSGHETAASVDIGWRFYGMAALAFVLSLLLGVTGFTGAGSSRVGERGLVSGVLSELGSVVIRPRLWLIVLAAACAGVPFGLFVGIWIADRSVTAALTDAAAPTAVAGLFAAGLALGGVVAGIMSDSVGRRRGILVIFYGLGALVLAILGLVPNPAPIYLGAIVVAGGLFCGSGVLFYALAIDRSPARHAGFFLALVNAAFVIGAAASASLAASLAPLTDVIDLGRFAAPLAMAAAALLAALVPDTGPDEQPAPVDPGPAGGAAMAADEARTDPGAKDEDTPVKAATIPAAATAAAPEGGSEGDVPANAAPASAAGETVQADRVAAPAEAAGGADMERGSDGPEAGGAGPAERAGTPPREP